MLTVFSEFFTAISKACESITIFKKKQSETDVLKTKKAKSKAVEYAEKIIFYIEEKHPDIIDDKTYKKLKKNFFKYN